MPPSTAIPRFSDTRIKHLSSADRPSAIVCNPTRHRYRSGASSRFLLNTGTCRSKQVVKPERHHSGLESNADRSDAVLGMLSQLLVMRRRARLPAVRLDRPPRSSLASA